MKRYLALLLVVILFAVSCTPAGTAEDHIGGADPEAPKVKLGLVTDTGGIDDKSFNQGTWEGLVAYKVGAKLEEENVKFLQSTSDADYIPNLTTLAEEGMDLVVAPGFLFEDAIKQFSTDFPEQKILFIDAAVDAPNVMNAVFAEHEGSYLVGVAAALKAQEAGKNKVGFIGGADFELIQKFEAGFEQGVKAIAPEMEIVIQYATAFDKPEEGQTLASKMYDDGVYVIYHAAGGTGNGAIKEAKDRRENEEDVWIIGVDKDQYEDGIYSGGDVESAILTSMIKRVDLAAYRAAQAVADGTFEGGTVEYKIKDEGVGIPAENPNLTDEWVNTINEYKDKIAGGEITVDPVPSRVK
ncbi:MAG TPA: BMP family ABC transporter substrate-binding protein [Tissierellia bacterium]|nr:BMP family ABC transporter substrate-binding protein [Tissierellia bacterium]